MVYPFPHHRVCFSKSLFSPFFFIYSRNGFSFSLMIISSLTSVARLSGELVCVNSGMYLSGWGRGYLVPPSHHIGYDRGVPCSLLLEFRYSYCSLGDVLLLIREERADGIGDHNSLLREGSVRCKHLGIAHDLVDKPSVFPLPAAWVSSSPVGMGNTSCWGTLQWKKVG